MRATLMSSCGRVAWAVSRASNSECNRVVCAHAVLLGLAGWPPPVVWGLGCRLGWVGDLSEDAATAVPASEPYCVCTVHRELNRACLTASKVGIVVNKARNFSLGRPSVLIRHIPNSNNGDSRKKASPDAPATRRVLSRLSGGFCYVVRGRSLIGPLVILRLILT